MFSASTPASTSLALAQNWHPIALSSLASSASSEAPSDSTVARAGSANTRSAASESAEMADRSQQSPTPPSRKAKQLGGSDIIFCKTCVGNDLLELLN